MSTVVILTTGGTIAMQRQGDSAGAVPALTAADFQRALPAGLPQVVAEEICNLPSAHVTLNILQTLRARTLAHLGRPDIAGVVITHGTDTLEETAAYLDLTVATEAPIVLTGAMRTASEPGYDGYANIIGAIRVAAAPAARGRGALAFLSDTIHAAREVTKIDPHTSDGFLSPVAGPLGRVIAGDVIFYRPADRRPVLLAGALERRVPLLKTYLDIPTDLLQFVLERGARGVVIEGMGACRVPPAWLPLIADAVRAGVTVAIATRCLRGRVYDQYAYRAGYRDLAAAGCLFSDGLNGPKCRIKLMAILGHTQDRPEIERLWQAA
jgi:L-asparaginase